MGHSKRSILTGLSEEFEVSQLKKILRIINMFFFGSLEKSSDRNRKCVLQIHKTKEEFPLCVFGTYFDCAPFLCFPVFIMHNYAWFDFLETSRHHIKGLLSIGNTDQFVPSVKKHCKFKNGQIWSRLSVVETEIDSARKKYQ